MANTGPDGPAGDLRSRQKLGFALCYVTSHLVLDLLDERRADAILTHCDKYLAFFDVRFGPGRETIGICLLDLADGH